MKQVRNILIGVATLFLLKVNNVCANLAADIIPSEAGTIATITAGENMGALDKVLKYINDSIFGILGLISIGMFIYVGFKLVSAQGNPEEMKKAFMTLVHVIIGLFVVAASWAFVKMVSGLII